MVQLFIVYYGLPMLLPFELSRLAAGTIAVLLNSAAYVGEIIRAGILSIDRGQMEAARSLGMKHWTAMRFIIIPQAFKNILPALGNEFIVLLKETAIAGYIALDDLTRAGNIVRGRTFDAYTPFILVALIYLYITTILTGLLNKLERRMRASD